MEASSESLINVFDMLNDRIYKMEVVVNKLLKHEQSKIIKKETKIYPNYLFDYPCNFRTDCVIPKYSRVIMLSMHDDDISIRSPLYTNMENIISKLPLWFKEDHVERIANMLKHNNEEDDQISIECKDVGINIYGFKCVDDYILSEYGKHSIPEILKVVPTIMDIPIFFLKGIKSMDELAIVVEKIHSIYHITENDHTIDVLPFGRGVVALCAPAKPSTTPQGFIYIP